MVNKEHRIISNKHLTSALLLSLSTWFVLVSQSLNAGSFSFHCFTVSDWPAIISQECQDYRVDLRAVSGSPEQIRATVCPVAGDDPENRVYLLYSHSPDWSVWLCRERGEEERPREPEDSVPVSINIIGNGEADNNNDDNGSPITHDDGYGGYGGDSPDDWHPGKPPGWAGIHPVLLNIASAGWLPAGLFSFVFGQNLPQLLLPSQAPVAFQQGDLSDGTEILVVMAGGQQRLYRRISLFGGWYLAGQTGARTLPSDEGLSGGFIAEDKWARVLAGVFGWGGKRNGKRNNSPLMQMTSLQGTAGGAGVLSCAGGKGNEGKQAGSGEQTGSESRSSGSRLLSGKGGGREKEEQERSGGGRKRPPAPLGTDLSREIITCSQCGNAINSVTHYSQEERMICERCWKRLSRQQPHTHSPERKRHVTTYSSSDSQPPAKRSKQATGSCGHWSKAAERKESSLSGRSNRHNVHLQPYRAGHGSGYRLFAGENERFFREIRQFYHRPWRLSPREASIFKYKSQELLRQGNRGYDREQLRAIISVRSTTFYVLSGWTDSVQKMDVIGTYLEPLGEYAECRRLCEEILIESEFVKYLEYTRFCDICSRCYLTEKEEDELTRKIKEQSERLLEWIQGQSGQYLDAFLLKRNHKTASEVIKYLIVMRYLTKPQDQIRFGITASKEIGQQTMRKLDFLNGAFFSWSLKGDYLKQKIITSQAKFLGAAVDRWISIHDHRVFLERLDYLMASANELEDLDTLRMLWAVYGAYYQGVTPFHSRSKRISRENQTMPLAMLEKEIEAIKKDFPYRTPEMKLILNDSILVYHTRCCMEGKGSYLEHKCKAEELAEMLSSQEKVSDIVRLKLVRTYIEVGDIQKAWTHYKLIGTGEGKDEQTDIHGLFMLGLELRVRDIQKKDDFAARETLFSFLEENKKHRICKIFKAAMAADASELEDITLKDITKEEEKELFNVISKISLNDRFLELFNRIYQYLERRQYDVPLFVHIVYVSHKDQVPKEQIRVCRSLLESEKVFTELPVEKAREKRTKLCVQYLIGAEKEFPFDRVESLYRQMMEKDIVLADIHKWASVFYWRRAVAKLNNLSKIPSNTRLTLDQCKPVQDYFDKAYDHARETGLEYFFYEIKMHLADLWERTTAFEDERIALTRWKPSLTVDEYYRMAHAKRPKKNTLNKEPAFVLENSICKNGRFKRRR